MRPQPDGQRILPTAIRTEMTINADGTLGAMTEGSTKPVTTVVTHAGITGTKRFRFNLP